MIGLKIELFKWLTDRINSCEVRGRIPVGYTARSPLPRDSTWPLAWFLWEATSE